MACITVPRIEGGCLPYPRLQCHAFLSGNLTTTCWMESDEEEAALGWGRLEKSP